MTTPRKVALITGSATGIGRACAVRFAREGFAIAVNYSRSESDAKETLAELLNLGQRLLCVGLRARVVDRDGEALAGEAHGAGAADAGGRAGDEGNFAGSGHSVSPTYTLKIRRTLSRSNSRASSTARVSV